MYLLLLVGGWMRFLTRKLDVVGGVLSGTKVRGKNRERNWGASFSLGAGRRRGFRVRGIG